MHHLQFLTLAQVHVNPAWQAWIEAAHRAHNIDAFEILRPVLLEDRRVLHCVLVRAGRAVDIARAGIPGSRWIGMIIGNLPIFDDHMVRKHATYRFVEAAANRLPGYCEIVPGAGTSGMDFCKSFFYTVESDYSSVCLEIRARSIPLDGVAPARNFPLKLYFRLQRSFGQSDLHTLPGGLDISTQIDQTRQGRRPQTREWTTSGVES